MRRSRNQAHAVKLSISWQLGRNFPDKIRQDAAMESIKTVFKERNIYLPLRYYGADDLSVGWEIRSIAENRDLFESLYSTHPLDCVSDINSYYYYLLTRKIFRMGELVHNPDIRFREKKDADLLVKLARNAEYTLSKTTDSAIKYINEQFEDIFLDERYEYDLKYISLDFIIECQKNINCSVFIYLCQNFSRPIIRRFSELRDTFIKYRFLFAVLFPSGDLDLLNSLGLEDTLGVWMREYQSKDSPFRQILDLYIDELRHDVYKICHDVHKVCSEHLPGRSIIFKAQPVVHAVAFFLFKINSKYAKKFVALSYFIDRKLLEYLCNDRDFNNFRIPAGDAELNKWNSIDSYTTKLTDLTHQAVSDGADRRYQSFLEKTPKEQNSNSVGNNFSKKREDYLLRLWNVNAENFLMILNNPERSYDYRKKVMSEINCISEQTCLSDDCLKVDVSMAFSALGIMISWINKPDNKEQLEFICYGASMFLCGLSEKLLRLMYLKTVKSDSSKYGNLKTEKLMLNDLLRESAPMTSLFSTSHKQGLAYFLICCGSAGRNYRNNLAHWETGMYPGLMTPYLTSCLLWLFTDVLNSVYLYFKTDNSSQADSSGEH